MQIFSNIVIENICVCFNNIQILVRCKSITDCLQESIAGNSLHLLPCDVLFTCTLSMQIVTKGFEIILPVF